MSIYSGFATRNLQQSYDQCVCDLLFVLQKRIIKFYQNAQTDQDKFFSIFSQLYHQITNMQKSKYLKPKSSEFVFEIFDYLKKKKQQRTQNPEQDLKKFQRSLAIKLKKQQEMRINEIQINNYIKRSSFSFGKIKKQIQNCQINNNKSESLKKKNNSTDNSFQNDNVCIDQKSKRVFSSKGNRNSKSFHEQIQQNLNEAKIRTKGGCPAQEIAKQYLQKINRNYVRGYRKRKIKDDFSSSHYKQIDYMKSKKIGQ